MSGLVTENLTKSFSGLVAIDDVTVDIPTEEIVSVIGPNGAGKTTFIDLLTGRLQPTSGNIYFNDRRIDGENVEYISKLGIGRTFQITNTFPGLTVYEHVRLAMQPDQLTSVRYFLNNYLDYGEHTDEVMAILEQTGIDNLAEAKAETLSHGQLRHLELATTLGMDPEIILLDEPTAGMGIEETVGLKEIIEEMSANRTIILVEHDMDVIKSLSDTIIVLHRGSIIANGTVDEVQNDKEVQQVYLATN